MEIPTTEQFQKRYPVFGSFDAERLEMVIQDAVLVVGAPHETKWPASHYATAVMLLTAHLLSGERTGEAMQAAGGDHIARERVGDVEITYRPLASDMGSTGYGARFQAMQRSLFSGPVIL